MIGRRRALTLAAAAPVATVAAVAARPAVGGAGGSVLSVNEIRAREGLAPLVSTLKSQAGRSNWRYPSDIVVVDYGMWTGHYARDERGTLTLIFSLEPRHRWSDAELAATLGIPAGDAPHG